MTLQPNGFSYLGAARQLLFADRVGMKALLMLQMPNFSAELVDLQGDVQHQDRV